jgi:hypothetical protein
MATDYRTLAEELEWLEQNDPVVIAVLERFFDHERFLARRARRLAVLDRAVWTTMDDVFDVRHVTSITVDPPLPPSMLTVRPFPEAFMWSVHAADNRHVVHCIGRYYAVDDARRRVRLIIEQMQAHA